jgi:hypothetical protein
MKHLFYLLPALMLAISVQAQTTLRLQYDLAKTAPDIWNCTVQHLNESTQLVYLTGSIREKNAGEVYEARSTSFNIVPGTHLLNTQALQPIEVLLNRLPNGDQLPNGQYWIHLILHDASNNRELAVIVHKMSITDAQVVATWKAAPSENNLRWPTHGRVRTLYNMNMPTQQQSALPRHFVRTDFHTSMNLYGIPLEINGLYSTEQGSGMGPTNQLSFSFDKTALKTAAINLLESRCSPESLFDSTAIQRVEMYRSILRDRRYPQFEDLKKRCDSLHIEEYLHAGQQLDQVQMALNNRTLKAQMEELKGLKSRYNITDTESLYAQSGNLPDSIVQQFGVLMRLEQSYLRLEQQRDDLTQKAAHFRKYEHLYRRLKKMEQQQSVRDLVTDNEDIRLGLRNTGQLSRLQNLLLGIDELDLGNTYPFFSPLVLNGVRVQGLNLGYTTARKWHVAVNIGRKQPGVLPDNGLALSQQYSYYTQYLGGVQLGWGRPEGNFIYLQHFRGADHGTAPDNMVATGETPLRPRSENYVTGLTFRYQDARQIVAFTGEINQSLWNADRTAYPLQEGNSANKLQLTGGTQRVGSALDWSYQGNIRVHLPNGRTRMSALIHHVGRGYRSLGVPFLLNDITRYEVRGQQDVFNKKLQAAGYLRRDFDQTSPLAAINRTFTTNYGVQLRYSPLQRLTLIADYAPYIQQRAGSASQAPVDRNGQLGIVSAQYREKLRGSQLNTQVTWMLQQLSATDSAAAYRINSLQSSTQWQHTKWGIALSGQYTPRRVQTISSSMYGLDASFTLNNCFKKLNFTFGGQYSSEPGRTTMQALYLRSALHLNRWISIDLNLRHALIERPLLSERFLQDYGWLGVGIRW